MLKLLCVHYDTDVERQGDSEIIIDVYIDYDVYCC